MLLPLSGFLSKLLIRQSPAAQAQPDVDARLRAERRGLLILHVALYCFCPCPSLLVEPSDICGRCGLLILHITAYCVCPFQNLLGEPSDICGRCSLLILHVAIYCFTPFEVYRTSLYTIVPSSSILRGGNACIPVLRSRSTNTPAHTEGRARSPRRRSGCAIC